jgi:sulfopyruvate decarboxylase subunit alpha
MPPDESATERTPDVMRPARTIRALINAGVTHVIGIPDNTSGPLFPEVRRHPTLKLITVTREREAFAIAAGLWLGGASPLVVVQNTGLLESGDSLRGTAVRMASPVPILIIGRGYAKMTKAGVTRDDPRTSELLTRANVDSTALLTEPTLEAWGIPFDLCGGEDDPTMALARTVQQAQTEQRPVALILTRPLT